jgi:hypothetical protein
MISGLLNILTVLDGTVCGSNKDVMLWIKGESAMGLCTPGERDHGRKWLEECGITDF